MIPLLAFLEACPGIGLFVSGVILLTVSTLLYTEQIATLSQILPLAFAGACLSDHLGFYIGRVFGPRLHQTAFAQKRKSEIAKSEAFILKFGTLSVLGGRLIPAVRSLVPMTIGISGTSRLKFSLVDLVACAIWAAGLGALVVGLESFLKL
jgi:membrane protein DedA with SNARE-associated domain